MTDEKMINLASYITTAILIMILAIATFGVRIKRKGERDPFDDDFFK